MMIIRRIVNALVAGPLFLTCTALVVITFSYVIAQLKGLKYVFLSGRFGCRRPQWACVGCSHRDFDIHNPSASLIMAAGHDLVVTAVQVMTDHDIVMAAGNNSTLNRRCKNLLDTGSLIYESIHNEANYSASSITRRCQ